MTYYELRITELLSFRQDLNVSTSFTSDKNKISRQNTNQDKLKKQPGKIGLHNMISI